MAIILDASKLFLPDKIIQLFLNSIKTTLNAMTNFKATFSLLLFLILSTTVFSQTKSETEQWILEKLRNNIQDFNEGNYVQISDPPSATSRSYNYQFSFDTGSLVVQFTKRVVSPRFDGMKYNFEAKDYSIKMLIPIYDINEITKTKDVNVLIPSKHWATCDQVEISTLTTTIKYFENDFEDLKESSITLNLLNENDENLASRLQKAFTYLKQFYSKPQKNTKKEIF